LKRGGPNNTGLERGKRDHGASMWPRRGVRPGGWGWWGAPHWRRPRTLRAAGQRGRRQHTARRATGVPAQLCLHVCVADTQRSPPLPPPPLSLPGTHGYRTTALRRRRRWRRRVHRDGDDDPTKLTIDDDDDQPALALAKRVLNHHLRKDLEAVLAVELVRA
jgi:hypothetical protein